MRFLCCVAVVVLLWNAVVCEKTASDDDDDVAHPCSGRRLTASRNFPNPDDGCSGRFFSCPENATHAIPRSCPASLVFDLTSDKCLESDYVGTCPGGKPTTEAPTTAAPPADATTPAFVFDCVGRRSGDYNHPNKPCSQLYASCVSGVLVIRECPSGLFFDAVSRDCLEEQFVKTCGGTATTPSSPEDSTPAFDPSEITCVAERGDYFVPNPANRCSSRYYSCASGVARRLECPSSLVFDVVSTQCIEPLYTAACGGSPTTTTEAPPQDQETDSGPDFDCSDKADGNYPSGDCESVYYACVAGQPSAFTCPNQLKYSAERDACLPSSRVASCPESQLPENVCQGQIDGFYPLTCTQYVFCSAQEPFLQICPEDTVFHPTNNRCVPPEDSPAPCGTAAEPVAFDCSNRAVGFYTRGDCAEYFYCEEDKSVWEFECSPGFAFDVRVNECLPKVRVPGCIPQLPAVDQQPFCLRRLNGLHAHPTDCRYAIVCLTGVAFELPCPTADLPRFDPEIGNCNVATDDCQPDANQRADIGLLVVDARFRGLAHAAVGRRPSRADRQQE